MWRQFVRMRRRLFLLWLLVGFILAGWWANHHYSSLVEIVLLTFVVGLVLAVSISIASIPFVLLYVWITRCQTTDDR